MLTSYFWKEMEQPLTQVLVRVGRRLRRTVLQYRRKPSRKQSKHLIGLLQSSLINVVPHFFRKVLQTRTLVLGTFVRDLHRGNGNLQGLKKRDTDFSDATSQRFRRMGCESKET